MKTFFTLCCILATAFLLPGLSAGEWHTDLEKAKAESLRTGRPIYILFTNSDSAACLGFERAIFSQKKFQDYADRNLVLMKADFPIAIHRQPKNLVEQNRKLRTQFGVTVFPTAFLLNSGGELYIDFVKADGSQEKHRRKINEIMDFDSPKRYSDYLDGFVKKYVPPKAAPALKTEAKPDARKNDPKKNAGKKPAAKKPAIPQEKTEETTIPDENGGTIRIPLDPEGDFQEWLKANSAESAAEKNPGEEAGAETKEAEPEQQTPAPGTEQPAPGTEQPAPETEQQASGTEQPAPETVAG